MRSITLLLAEVEFNFRYLLSFFSSLDKTWNIPNPFNEQQCTNDRFWGKTNLNLTFTLKDCYK